MLYFDNAATTQVNSEVYSAMLPYIQNSYGNPTSKYYPLALSAKEAVLNSSEVIANIFKISPDELIYTSGATESNNMIIKGVAFAHLDKKGHFITSKVEHNSVLNTYHFLEQLGFKVTYLDVDRYGRINTDNLERSITPETLLCSIIWANNEVGSLNDIENIAKICQDYQIPLHVDATQVIGKYAFNLDQYPGIKYLTGSGHKVFGPKGIGFAIIRKDADGVSPALIPLIHGGGQQNNYRSGTLPVHLIVGLSKAIELVSLNLEKNIKHLELLELSFIDKIKSLFGDVIYLNSDTQDKVHGIVNVQLKGVNNELLLKKISPYVAASTGSACSVSEPSHVLKAMGYSLEEIRNSIRFSFSVNNTLEEIDQFINLFK